MFVAFLISAFRMQAAYRSQVWALLFGVGLDVFARISIWRAVYGDATSVNGVSLPEMVTYAMFAAALFNGWDSTQLVRDIGESIRSGDVVNQLLKPYAYPMALFAQQVGTRLFYQLVIGVPVIVVMGLAYGIEPPASLGHGLLFIGYFVVSVVILMLIGIVFGLFAFWVLDAHSLEWFMRGFLAVMSGWLVPLWFFPPGFADIARLLPFSWIAFHPLAAYLGQMDLVEAGLMLLLGVFWVAALGWLIAFVWSRTCDRLIVQGG